MKFRPLSSKRSKGDRAKGPVGTTNEPAYVSILWHSQKEQKADRHHSLSKYILLCYEFTYIFLKIISSTAIIFFFRLPGQPNLTFRKLHTELNGDLSIK